MEKLKALQKKITNKRKEMIRIANNTSFTDKDTVNCSQELDKLLVKYQKTKSQNK